MGTYYADEGETQDFLSGLLPCAFVVLSMLLCGLVFFGGRTFLDQLEPVEIIPDAPVPLAAVRAIPRYSWSNATNAAYSDEYVINVSLEGVMEFYQQQGATCVPFTAPPTAQIPGYVCEGKAQPLGSYSLRIHRQADIKLSQSATYPAGETMIFLQVQWQR